MTSELRPAEEVAIRVRRAWEAAISCGPEESANQAAAAVIEADREAVRAIELWEEGFGK